MGWIIRNNELLDSDFNDIPSFPSYPLSLALWRTGETLQTGLHYDLTFPSHPLAPALWRITERGLETGLFKVLPTPNQNWIIGDNGLQTKSMPDPIYLGAFANNPLLMQISIPKTVKSIGRYAFYGTRINYVKIARDCTYYPTSFPEGTLIEFYDEEDDNNG